MQHKHIIKSLPLLASVLGRKYGVRVRIGGDRAFTDGNIIQLPELPLEGDENLLGLVRGCIDHESAHVRDTDFAALKAAKLSPLEQHLWNILEDWRVENKLSGIFPGCRENFRWLIKHFFLQDKTANNSLNLQDNDALHILDWLLISVRSWDVPELAQERDRLKALVDNSFPGLARELEAVLQRIQSRCDDTQDAITFAREFAEIIKKYLSVAKEQGHAAPSLEALQSLRQLLRNGSSEQSRNIGERIRESLTQACERTGERLRVAVPTGKQTRPLSARELLECRQTTTALRIRLQALLQSRRLVRNHSGFTGRLNLRKLHTLASGNAKVFLRKGERAAINTAAHILLDASGSMSGRAVDLAGQACFAVASALHGIHGISVGVSAFPGIPLEKGEERIHWQTVAPILGHGSNLHSSFGMSAAGGTPMDSALWWVLQQLHPLPEPRKIILIITDGKPDFTEPTLAAINAACGMGMEVYGIGIIDAEIQKLLPGKASRVINSVRDLAPAMFDLLQKALVSG